MLPTRRWLPLALGVALMGGSVMVYLQRHLDTTLSPLRQMTSGLYLPSPSWVKRLSLGYDGLLGCIYWTRAVQHYGRERLARSGRYDLLYPLLDIATTLDPELIIAYRFGAIFLSELSPLGPQRPDLAVRLLRKGIEANPEYWRFWFDLGFVYYWSLKDYARAAEAFLEGSRRPGALPWMKVMAARVAAEGGAHQTSIFLWREIYNSSDDPSMRQNALHHLYQLKAEEDIEQLEKLLVRYQREKGKPARAMRELIEAGYILGYPVDPLGYAYRLDSQGKVVVHPESPLAELGAEKKP